MGGTAFPLIVKLALFSANTDPVRVIKPIKAQVPGRLSIEINFIFWEFLFRIIGFNQILEILAACYKLFKYDLDTHFKPLNDIGQEADL